MQSYLRFSFVKRDGKNISKIHRNMKKSIVTHNLWEIVTYKAMRSSYFDVIYQILPQNKNFLPEIQVFVDVKIFFINLSFILMKTSVVLV